MLLGDSTNPLRALIVGAGKTARKIGPLLP
jgi:hypothetical protein